MRTIQIDQKTFLQVRDGRDIEEAKEKFLDKLRISREKKMRSRIILE